MCATDLLSSLEDLMMFTQICSNLSWDPEDRQSHTNTSLMGLTRFTHTPVRRLIEKSLLITKPAFI